MTGRRDVGAVAGSFSSPRFSARRHLKTWFAFTPWHEPPPPHSHQAQMSAPLSAASPTTFATGESAAQLPLPLHQP